MIEIALLEDAITQCIACDHVAVRGDGKHFKAVIVSSLFVGKSLLERHRFVFQHMKDLMAEQIHALSLETYTLDEWEEKHERP